MVGHERYQEMTASQYDRKTLMHFLCRLPADKRLLPIVCSIQHKKILDVGLGTGEYTKLLLEHANQIVGVDQNPHLCALPITVHAGDAGNLSQLLGNERFDIVLSTWMTDYLDAQHLQRFFVEAKSVLHPNGRIITTVIERYGFGAFYTTIAKLVRGVDKYTHRKKTIKQMLYGAGFKQIEFIALPAWIIPWAQLVIAE